MKMRADIELNKQSAEEDYQNLPENLQQKLSWFQDQKIGVIFHWGLYSQAGIVESWQLSEEDDWARKPAWKADLATLRKEYWQLNQVFNPVHFDPDLWAEECKQAGFRYMLFTTKHHDGFTMYDTQESDYRITAATCPFHTNQQADVFGEVMKSFQKKGIATGAYYSKADWHSPDYWRPNEQAKGRYASYDPLQKPAIWRKFNQFVRNQLIEICSNYGPVDILWLDGGWVNKKNEQLDMEEIADKVRQQQPNLLIVDRTIGGSYENYVTPERKIPKSVPKKVWESNIPLANNWGYVPNDSYKPFATILKNLLEIVSLGGNLILGIGPKPDGRLPEEALAIMKKLGDFLRESGEGIYGSRAVPEIVVKGWYFTQKQQVIYGFHLVDEQEAVTLNIADLKKDQVIQVVENLRTGEVIELIENRLSVIGDEQTVVAIKIVYKEVVEEN